MNPMIAARKNHQVDFSRFSDVATESFLFSMKQMQFMISSWVISGLPMVEVVLWNCTVLNFATCFMVFIEL